ncbi:MAG: phosphotransferase [Nanoarchaeota archaeon]|nr:phosphotransferase [Nanoarchaeota archaeon]
MIECTDTIISKYYALDTGLDRLIRILQEDENSVCSFGFSDPIGGSEDDPAMKRFYQFYSGAYEDTSFADAVNPELIKCLVESQNNRFKDTVKGRICDKIFSLFFKRGQHPNPERVLGFAIAQAYAGGKQQLQDIDLAAELDYLFSKAELLPQLRSRFYYENTQDSRNIQDEGWFNEEIAKLDRKLESLMSAARILNENYKLSAQLARHFAIIECEEEMYYWLRETVQRGLRNPVVNLKRRFRDSANTVFSIDLPEFQGLIFKEGERGSIEDEVQKIIAITSGVQYPLPGEEYIYSNPLLIVDAGKKAYGVFREANVLIDKSEILEINWTPIDHAITINSALQYIHSQLIETAEDNARPEWWDNEVIYKLARDIYIRRAIKSIVRLQNSASERETNALPFFDYCQYLEEKVLGQIHLGPDLHDKALQVAAHLNTMKRYVAHGDFHLENILAIGKVGTCVVDFQKACMADQFYDLAFLLEQAELELTEGEKKQLIDSFVQQVTTTETMVGAHRAYDLNAAFINLKEAKVHGNKNNHYFNEELSRRHLERATLLLRKYS